jgi:hypothetical protein
MIDLCKYGAGLVLCVGIIGGMVLALGVGFLALWMRAH